MADPYRFGGPIPDAAFRLRVRRERRAEEERATQYERDAKPGVVRVHPMSSDEPISLDLQKAQARDALALFEGAAGTAAPNPCVAKSLLEKWEAAGSLPLSATGPQPVRAVLPPALQTPLLQKAIRLVRVRLFARFFRGSR